MGAFPPWTRLYRTYACGENSLIGIGPASIQNDARRFERLDAGRKITRIIDRVYPEQFLVGQRETCVFQTHEGDVIDEREVASKPLASLS